MEKQVVEEDVEKLVGEAVALGESFLSQFKYSQADVVFSQILKVDPNHARTKQLLGLTKYGLGRYKEAIILFQELLNIDPCNPEHFNNISLAYAGEGKFDIAEQHLMRAIALDPKHTHYYSNLGLQFRQRGNLPQALEYFQKAINVNENNHFAWINMGSVYGRLKNLDESIKCLEKASSIKPNDKMIRANLAYAYFLKGDLKKGWEEYENRHDAFKQLEYFKKLYDQNKRWHGTESLKHKRIIVYCEQGVGDAIQFCRFLPFLKELNPSSILFHAPDELNSLIVRNSQLGYTAVASSFKKDQYDYFCSVMSLPHLLQINSINSDPYLDVPVGANFQDYKDYLKIGIVWAGNPRHPNDVERSCKLSYFKPLQFPGVKLFSLQKDLNKRKYTFSEEAIDLSEGCEDMAVVDMSPYLTDLEKTAMIIKSLDIVITVDTAVLHLSGAMGKETWGLLPYNPDWRWGLDGETTLWYPSVRLFRQQTLGDWDGVFEKIKTRLEERLSK